MQFSKMAHFSNLQFKGEVNTAWQLWSILVNAHRLYFQLVVITVSCIVGKCENFMSAFYFDLLTVHVCQNRLNFQWLHLNAQR